MKRLRSGLFVVALAVFPQIPLAGALLYLLWWLWPAPPAMAERRAVSRLQMRLGAGFCLLSLLTGLVCARPLWHAAGWLSHYLLPVAVSGATVRALHRRRLRPETLFAGLLAAGFGLAGLGLGNYFLHWQSHPQWLCSPAYGRFCLIDLLLLAEDRARGFSMHPNVLGALLALAVPLWLQAPGQWPRWRWPLLGGLATVLLALAVSYSRASWLAAAVALSGGLLWRLPALNRRGWLWLPAGLGLAGLLRGPALLARLSPLQADNPRLQLWAGGLHMLADHLWLGTGLLQVEPLFGLYLPPIAGGAGHLHNWYLQVAVESGLPAACLLFALLGSLLGRPGQRGPWGQAAWLSWAGFLLASLFDVTVLDSRVAFELSLLLGWLIYERRGLSADKD